MKTRKKTSKETKKKSHNVILITAKQNPESIFASIIFFSVYFILGFIGLFVGLWLMSVLVQITEIKSLIENFVNSPSFLIFGIVLRRQYVLYPFAMILTALTFISISDILFKKFSLATKILISFLSFGFLLLAGELMKGGMW